MSETGNGVQYKTGIVLTDVVDAIQDLFGVLTKDEATTSAKKYAILRLEYCILQLQNLKSYLKRSV